MLTEFASQKRVYEVVAKPVVEVNFMLEILLALHICSMAAYDSYKLPLFSKLKLTGIVFIYLTNSLSHMV